ncbi:MAG: cation transporter [Eubacteriales bacterium]
MTYKMTVSGLDCPNCAKKLATLIEKKEGIANVRLNFLSESLTLDSDLDFDAVLAAVKKAVSELGEKVTVKRR